MKMNKLTMAALALAAIGFTSTAASAFTVGSEDLILGFQVPSGTGASTNLEVDLGSFSLFTTTATLTLNQLSVNDLTATYGAGWASAVTWSVAGITPDVAASSFYATSTTSIKTSGQSALSVPYSNIQSLNTGLNGATATANSPKSATIGDSSTAASAIPTSYTSTEMGNGFAFIPNAELTGSGSNELYSFTPQNKVGSGKTAAYPAAIDLGTFSLTSAGVLTYAGINSAQAVPEPSAYALGICAVLLFVVLRRRHSVA